MKQSPSVATSLSASQNISVFFETRMFINSFTKARPCPYPNPN